MSMLASKTYVASAKCAFFSLLLVVGQPPLCRSAAPTELADDQWVSKAEQHVKELLDLVHGAPEMEDFNAAEDTAVARAVASSIGGQRLANLQRADKILWILWQTTGMPPVVRGCEKPLRIWLEENALAYRQYVNRNASLTAEQLQRKGLANTVRSIGSPLWYMTMRYLTEKTGVQFASKVEVDVVPNHFIIELPLPPEVCNSLADAMARWLDANKHHMTWDPHSGRFRPLDGTYLRTNDLSDAISKALVHPRSGEKPASRPRDMAGDAR